MGSFNAKMFDENDCEEIIKVKKLSSKILGDLIMKRFGKEDQHKHLKEEDQATLRLLRAATAFIPEVIKVSADPTNTVFIFLQPGKQFAIKAGKGNWEFFFTEDANEEIHGQWVGNSSLWHCVWNGTWCFVQRVSILISVIGAATQIINTLKALIMRPRSNKRF